MLLSLAWATVPGVGFYERIASPCSGNYKYIKGISYLYITKQLFILIKFAT